MGSEVKRNAGPQNFRRLLNHLCIIFLVLRTSLADLLNPVQPPKIIGIEYDKSCANSSVELPADLSGRLDFNLFTFSTSTPQAGHGLCAIKITLDQWPIGYALAAAAASIRGPIALVKGTRLFRVKTTFFTTFPVCCIFLFHFPRPGTLSHVKSSL